MRSVNKHKSHDVFDGVPDILKYKGNDKHILQLRDIAIQSENIRKKLKEEKDAKLNNINKRYTQQREKILGNNPHSSSGSTPAPKKMGLGKRLLISGGVLGAGTLAMNAYSSRQKENSLNKAAKDKTSSAENYKLKIEGEKVQNVGLRKAFHRLLSEQKVKGVAVNDPYKNEVEAFISGPDKKRKEVYKSLTRYLQKKTGKKVKISETKEVGGLFPIRLSKRDLEDVSASQYLAYMLTSGENRQNTPGLGIQKAEAEMMPRFALKKIKGEYVGKLPHMGLKQLRGDAPHYKKFMKKNHKVSIPEALYNMHPEDNRRAREMLSRFGEKSFKE